MTNRGKKLMFDAFFRGATPPTTFYLALVTSAAAPGPDTNTLSDLTEIAAGNGYTAGGTAVARNSTDFDTLTEDDATDMALLMVKNIVFTASGGVLPGSGAGARYAVLLTDEATVADRQVVDYWSLGSDRSVSDGQSLTIADLTTRAKE